MTSTSCDESEEARRQLGPSYMNDEPLEWLVSALLGVRTRVCFDTPSGAHPLTPEPIRQRYALEVRKAALVVWHLPSSGLGGVRAGIDEVTWRDADIAHFETSFCRPAKGSGYVWLSAQSRNGQTLGILLSDQYTRAIYEWHLAAASLIERTYPGLTRVRDDGYDA